MASIYRDSQLVEKVNNAKLTNPALLLQAGIDPKTGLPIKITCGETGKEGIRHLLRLQDEQQAVNRYTWYSIPCSLSSAELERLIYLRGQLCFFYCEPMGEFMVLPYAKEGTMDVYGRYNYIHPLPIYSGESEEEKRRYTSLANWLSTIKLKVVNDPLTELPDEDDLKKSAVIIRDYTPQMGQDIIPRVTVNEGIINIESECIPLMRTALHNACGVLGLRVTSQDEQSNVIAANKSFDNAAMKGERYVPIMGGLEFQDLSGTNGNNIQDFWLAMQSLDNFRLSTYGLKGGLMEKQEHMLQDEMTMNTGIASFPLVDGLNQRQRACDIINSIWAIGIDCEISEIASGMDKDMNGEISSDEEADQSNPIEYMMDGGEEDVQ